MKECPSEFWAVQIQSYVTGVIPATVFNPDYCVPSVNLNNTEPVSYKWCLKESIVATLLGGWHGQPTL